MMRKVATLIAVGASFALAGAASAVPIIQILGPNTPGTHTYSIQFSWLTADTVAGYSVSVQLTGALFTPGVFTDTVPAGFAINPAGPTVPIVADPSLAGSWAGAALGGSVAGPAMPVIIGTFESTVTAGDVLTPIFRTGDGVVTPTPVTQIPTQRIGLTIIPEPTTAALLGLGLIGLVVVGRRSRV